MTTLAFVLIKFKNIGRNGSKSNITAMKNQLQILLGQESIFFVENNDFSYDAVAKITTTSIDALYRIVVSSLSESPIVQETTTMIVIDQ